MAIAYVCNPTSAHEAKWISYFAQNYRVIIICTESTAELHPLLTEVPVFRILPDAYPLADFWRRRKYLRRVKDVLQQEEVSVVHAMYAIPNAFYPFQAGCKNYLVTTRGSDLLLNYKVEYHQTTTLKERIRNYFLRKLTVNSLQHARFITSTSLKQQQVLQEFVKDTEKMQLIRTGVDPALFINQNIKRTHKDHAAVKVFCPRSMLPVYNLELLVEAIERLKRKDKSYQLVLLDDKPNTQYANYIRKMVADKKLEDKVVFMPRQTFEGMKMLYQEAELVAMVPASDGTPNSGIESMLMKKPLILPNLPYDKDIFNDETVWQLKSYSPSEIADTIEEVAAIDENLRQQKVENAFAVAMEKANLHCELEKVERIYQSMQLKSFSNLSTC